MVIGWAKVSDVDNDYGLNAAFSTFCELNAPGLLYATREIVSTQNISSFNILLEFSLPTCEKIHRLPIVWPVSLFTSDC